MTSRKTTARPTADLVGGPHGARTVPMAMDPAGVCHRVDRNASDHYRRQREGRYIYAGPCSTFHTIDDPIEGVDVCCCGVPGCQSGLPAGDTERLSYEMML